MSTFQMEVQKHFAELALLTEHEFIYAEHACPVTGCTYVCASWPQREIEAFETVRFNTTDRRSEGQS